MFNEPQKDHSAGEDIESDNKMLAEIWTWVNIIFIVGNLET